MQPRMLNLARQSSKWENNIFRHARSLKRDSCRAGSVISKPEAPR